MKSLLAGPHAIADPRHSTSLPLAFGRIFMVLW